MIPAPCEAPCPSRLQHTSVVVALAAHQAARPDLIRSPKRVLAHTWEGLLECVTQRPTTSA
jgi:hypothetical protein